MNADEKELINVALFKEKEGGIHNDIWKKIKHKLNNKYIFKDHYITYADPDHMLQDVYKGKYDLIIGPFIPTAARDKFANFSNIVTKNPPVFIK